MQIDSIRFVNECRSAGVTDFRFVVGSDDVWVMPDAWDYPQEQWAIVQAVLAAHDPSRAVIDAARSAINARRNELEFGVFVDSYGHRYDVDERSRARITGAVTMAAADPASIPVGFRWTDADDNDRPHTAASIIALGTEIMAWTSAVHEHARSLKQAIEHGENPDIETCWPGQQ